VSCAAEKMLINNSSIYSNTEFFGEWFYRELCEIDAMRNFWGAVLWF